jgi:hypothetical protein
MANPNIVNVASIYGQTTVTTCSTSPANIAVNATGSNSVVKVDTVYCSNSDNTTGYTVTIDLQRGGTAYNVASSITVPSGGSLDVLSKQVWLLEGDVMRAYSNAASKIQVVCSYEVIS